MMKNNPFEEINEKLDFLSELILNGSNNADEPQTPKAADILNIEEASALLRIPVPTIRHHMKNNRLPYKKPGKRILFRKKELLEWLDKFSSGRIEEEKRIAFKKRFRLK